VSTGRGERVAGEPVPVRYIICTGPYKKGARESVPRSETGGVPARPLPPRWRGGRDRWPVRAVVAGSGPVRCTKEQRFSGFLFRSSVQLHPS
jgi:hypothetical protein